MTRRRLLPAPLLAAAALAGCTAAAPPPSPAPAAVAVPTAAPERPRPYPVEESPGFARAVERGTRTRTGRPGPAYWQQRASYRIDAELDPAANRLTGRETVTYVNESPDTLRRVAVYLRQNLFAPGAPRTIPVPVTGGMRLTRVTVNGREMPRVDPGPSTVAWIDLPEPLAPRGGRVELAFEWSFAPPPVPSDGREGQDGEVFFLGYWYPQLAVYDDVSGWAADPYLGSAEFYMGYADYDVRVTVPEGWVVGGTGRLLNPDEVLTPLQRERLASARPDGEVVHVVDAADLAARRATPAGRNGRLTWHFGAEGVRDFAWGTSARYLWDATRALVGARPDTVDCFAYYRATPQAAAWVNGARYDRNAVEFLSRYLWPYPWRTMSAFEGILLGGGMEYPTVTVIQSYADSLRLAGNLMHEIGHMWFPMQVGSNETRHPWQDEGLTQFNSAQGQDSVYHVNRQDPYREAYLGLVRSGREVPLTRHGDLYGDPEVYSTQPYDKTATVLVALRAILGTEVFQRAYREYGRRWTGRHPQPEDFWNTFEEVSGRDLDWFWRTWWWETWPLDQAVAEVRTGPGGTEVVVVDRGLAPMPVRLAVTRADGSTTRLELPVEPWLAGARRQVARVPAGAAVTRVEIDPERVFPDVDRSNQVWSATGAP